jgi:hypothetical protein
MAANISFNPVLVTNAPGTFYVSSDGYIQGTMLDDPAVRYALAGGVLAGSETLPMWGGVAIFENIGGASPTTAPDASLGSLVGRASSVAGIAGFSVFNQASNWVTSPQSRAPSAGNYMSVPFFRLGSGARIAVACDPSVASLEGGATNQNVSWDFNNQVLTEYDASTPTITINSATWASTDGGQITANVTNWTGAFQPGAGDYVNISGATNSGTGGNGAVNGNFQVFSSTGTTAVLTAPAASGVIATIGGSPVFNFGDVALPVKVLSVSIGNCQTITYNPVLNTVNWQENGSCAVILL